MSLAVRAVADLLDELRGYVHSITYRSTNPGTPETMPLDHLARHGDREAA